MISPPLLPHVAAGPSGASRVLSANGIATEPDDMNAREIDEASIESARGGPVASTKTHTKSGAPTDKAHLEAGDGSLLGSIPAGLSIEELQEIARSDQSV